MFETSLPLEHWLASNPELIPFFIGQNAHCDAPRIFGGLHLEPLFWDPRKGANCNILEMKTKITEKNGEERGLPKCGLTIILLPKTQHRFFEQSHLFYS